MSLFLLCFLRRPAISSQGCDYYLYADRSQNLPLVWSSRSTYPTPTGLSSLISRKRSPDLSLCSRTCSFPLTQRAKWARNPASAHPSLQLRLQDGARVICKNTKQTTCCPPVRSQHAGQAATWARPSLHTSPMSPGPRLIPTGPAPALPPVSMLQLQLCTRGEAHSIPPPPRRAPHPIP